MKKQNENITDASILRQKAEELSSYRDKTLLTSLEKDMLKLIHEFEAHQNKLERQQEELVKAKDLAESTEKKYAELFDFAPSGYFTLSKEGKILEINCVAAKMLGKERQQLRNVRFDTFVSTETIPAFNLFLQKVFATQDKVTCEVTLTTHGCQPMHIILAGACNQERDQCRVFAVDITGHKNDAFHESEDHYQFLFNKAPFGYQSLDFDGNFLCINQQWLETFGYAQEEVIGKWFGDFLTPAFRDEFDKRFPIFKAQGHIHSEFEMVHRNGSILFIAFEGRIGYDLNGNFKQTHCILQDITGRRKEEENLKKFEWMLSRKPSPESDSQVDFYNQVYGSLTELNHDGLILKSIGHERLRDLSNDYLELLGTSSAIYEANGDYAFGIFASSWCQMMDLASRGLCNTADNAEAMKSGRWLCHESCWTSCSREAIIKNTPIDIECHGGIRLYSVPIIAAEKVVGAINFGYSDPPKDPEKLRKLADAYQINYDDLFREAKACDSRPLYIIEMAKKRLHATARLIGSMVETKLAEEALRESEEKYRVLFNTNPLGINVSDSSGKIVESNTRAIELLGLSKDEIEARHIDGEQWRIIRPDGTPMPTEEYASTRALKENRLVENVEMGIVRANEEITWINVTAAPLLLENFGVAITYNDITERKQAEEALKNREHLLNKVFDLLPIGLWFADKNGRLIRGNPAGVKIWGAEPTVPIEEYGIFKARRLPSGNKIDPDDWALTHTIRKGVTIIDELLEIEAFDGQKKIILNYTAPVLDDQGNIQGAIAVNHDITERKKAEEALKASENGLHEAQRIARLGSWEYDVASNKIYGSEEGFRIFGIEHSASGLLPLKEVEGCIPEIRRVHQALVDLIEKDAPYDLEYVVNPADGEYPKIVISKAVLIKDIKGNPLKVKGVLQDITHRKEAEKALRKSEEKYRTLTENMKDVVWTLDTKTLSYTYVSPSVKNLRGYTPEEIITQPLDMAFTPQASDAMKALIRQRVANYKANREERNNYYSDEVEQPCKDGSTVWTEVITRYVLNEKTGNVDMHGVTRNIAERKKAEEQIIIQNKELHTLNSQKDKFFSIIAHDLKSPFNSIMGFSEMLVEQINEKDYDGVVKFAEIILNSSHRAVDLLMNLMEWSRSQTGRMEFSPEYFELVKLTEETCAQLNDSADQKSIKLHKDIPNKLPLFADKNMISTVIRNLISNAIKFTGEGGEIIISAKKDQEEILFSVKDNGLGISPNRIKKLFRIDSNESSYGTNKEKGTGLGLILCKEFVEKHGGRIWVESELDKGSEFFFTLPCK